MKTITSVFTFIGKHAILFFLLVFGLFVSFIDSNSLWERHYTWQSIKNLESEINHYSELYRRDSIRLAELENTPERLEQIAREKYNMTRPNEDLFIINYKGE